MGRFYDAVTYAKPVLDYGWRTAIFPAGTSYATALAHEQTVQGELGNAVVAGSAVVLLRYWVRGTADYLPDLAFTNDDDHGWRDVVAQTRAVVLRYRITGPNVHAL